MLIVTTDSIHRDHLVITIDDEGAAFIAELCEELPLDGGARDLAAEIRKGLAKIDVGEQGSWAGEVSADDRSGS